MRTHLLQPSDQMHHNAPIRAHFHIGTALGHELHRFQSV